MAAAERGLDRPPTKSAQTRARILDATARLLSDRGYTGTSLAAIAEASRLKVGSLYYYFDSKDELIYEVFRLGTTRSLEHVRQAVSQLGPTADACLRLRVAINAHLESLHTQGPYSSAGLRIVEQSPETIRRRQYVNQRAYGEFWQQLLEDAQRAGVIDPAADLVTVRLLLFGAMNSSIDWPRPARRTAAEVTEAIARLIGLRSAAEASP
jgi:AcrR family transcriptional regulator